MDNINRFAIIDGGTWDTLIPSLKPSTMNTINRLGFNRMSPVQAAAIPLFLTNKDVLVEACTGSGKTLSFVIPIIEMILRRDELPKKNDIVSVVISPTRELASQIHKVILEFTNDLAQKQPEINNNNDNNNNDNNDIDDIENNNNINNVKHIPISISTLLLIGGTEIYQDILSYRAHGANIIIGTPGRVDEFLNRICQSDQLRVRGFEVLILDEADKLLDMGFQLPLTSILSKIPKQRRTGLFSATQTSELKELARTGMRNPIKVHVSVQSSTTLEEQSIPSTLNNRYMICPVEDKFNQLFHFLLNRGSTTKTIIYFLTCAHVDYFYKLLKSFSELSSVALFSLHGKAPHSKRIKIFDDFSAATSGVLLSTDLASRGLDIPNVDWVVQYDAPQDPKAFVHRIGRTARMGRDGNALLFLDATEDTYLDFLKIKKVPLEQEPLAENVPDRYNQVQQILLSNREVMEKSIIAFVSHIRAYKEHFCSYIFIFHRIDYPKLARGYGLLRLPRMPELKDKVAVYETGITQAMINSIPYIEKSKEKQRITKNQNIEKAKMEEKLKQIQIVKKRKLDEIKNEKLEVERKEQEKKIKESKELNNDDIKEINDDFRETKRLKTKTKRNKYSDLLGNNNLDTTNLIQREEQEKDQEKEIDQNKVEINEGDVKLEVTENNNSGEQKQEPVELQPQPQPKPPTTLLFGGFSLNKLKEQQSETIKLKDESLKKQETEKANKLKIKKTKIEPKKKNKKKNVNTAYNFRQKKSSKSK